MAEPNETQEMGGVPAEPDAIAEQQPQQIRRVTALEELLHTVSSLMNEDNLRRLCNHYGYCTENRNFATALELFQFLEEGNLWGCGTVQDKVKVLIERMKELGRYDIVEIIQTFKNQVVDRDVVPPPIIRVNLDVVNVSGQCQLQVNALGHNIVQYEGNVYTLTTAIFRRSDVRRLLAIGGSVTVVGYALHKLGYNAGPFYRGSIAFDITTEPAQERTVRRRLENGTFLQELREEVKDIIEDHSDILGDLKNFTIISCKEILPNKKKEGYDEVKNVGMKDLPSISRGVNIVQGVKRKAEPSVHEIKELKKMMVSFNKKVDRMAETNQTLYRDFPHKTLRNLVSKRDIFTEKCYRSPQIPRPLTYSPTSSYILSKERARDVSTYKRKNVHVLNCSSNLYGDHLINSDEKVYPIRHNSPKAHVLILNNYEGFKGGSQHHRHEAERDVELMKQLWKGFQCEVEVEENQTAEKMLKSLVKFSQSDIHEKCDFCVVIILGHGNFMDGQNVVCGIDDKNIPTEDVVQLFHNSTDRPHLFGKPKLIFFQSSRKDSASPEATVPLTAFNLFTQTLSFKHHIIQNNLLDTDAPTLQEEQAVCTKEQKVPEESDILVAYPTVKGDMSFRNEATGSWFIKAIATVFSEQAKNEHVADMMTMVRYSVSQQMANAPMKQLRGCQVSTETQDRLRKKLYLFPGFPKTNN